MLTKCSPASPGYVHTLTHVCTHTHTDTHTLQPAPGLPGPPHRCPSQEPMVLEGCRGRILLLCRSHEDGQPDPAWVFSPLGLLGTTLCPLCLWGCF